MKPGYRESFKSATGFGKERRFRRRRDVVAWSVLGLLVLVIIDMGIGLSRPAVKSNKKPTSPVSKEQSNKQAGAVNEIKIGIKVKASTLNMRSTAEIRADNIVGQLSRGEMLQVVKKEGEWYKVKEKNGREGFVSASEDFVEVIK